MSDSNNALIARKIIQAVTDFDFETAHDLVAEDVVVEQPYAVLGQPTRYQGRDAFIGGLSIVPTLFKEFVLTITALYDCPEKNTVIFEQKSKGVFLADGSIYQNEYLIILTFQDGKVAFWKEYYNPKLMEEGMGPIMAQMADGA